MNGEPTVAGHVPRRMILSRLVIPVILAILFLPAGLSAQGIRGSTGPMTDRNMRSPMLRGRVLDERTSFPLPNVQVRLENRAGVDLNQDFTDSSGRFQFLGLATMAYVIRIRVDGYEEFRATYRIFPGTRGFTNEMIFMRRLKPDADKAGPSGDLVSLEELSIPPPALEAYEQGRVLVQEDRLEESLVVFQRAIELHPEFHSARVALATAYFRLNDFEAARDTLVEAAKLAPEHMEIHRLLALAAQQLGDSALLVETLTAMVRIAPDDFGAHAELARELAKAGRLDQAAEHARAAHDLNLEYPSIHLLLFNIALEADDLETAEDELREFLEKFPTHSAVPDVRQRLQQLERSRGSGMESVPRAHYRDFSFTNAEFTLET